MNEHTCYLCGHTSNEMLRVAPWNNTTQWWCTNPELCRARAVANKLEADGYFNKNFGGWQLVDAG